MQDSHWEEPAGLDAPAARRDLAQVLRDRLFDALTPEVTLVVSADAANVAYLSGYGSMAHDLVPQYRSAVLASRSQAALVVSAADAGPALEVLQDPARLYPYGEFFFETPDGVGAFRPAAPGFAPAFAQALEDAAGQGHLVGVDRSDGDGLWDLCLGRFGAARLRDITPELKSCRSIKSCGEVLRLRHATLAVESGLRRVMAEARAGMTEWDLARMMAAEMVAHGGVPRLLSVTSGPRSALADAYPSNRRIAPGDTVRIDAGCTVAGYWSDMARTLVFGVPDTRQLRTYAALRSGLEAQLEAVREGIAARDLFDLAVRTVRANGLPGYRRQHCGHGIGLRSYDSPVVNASDPTILGAGMCLCLETPYYLLGTDGMMVEDTVLVTGTGHEPVTTLPRDLIVLG